MMRASEEKHFSKPTRLTDFLNYFLFICFIFYYYFLNYIYFWGGILLSIWINIYFSKLLRLLDNLILMQ